MEIMSIATEGKKYIEELEAHLDLHEATIERMEGHERDYANEIVELSQALENEQTTKKSLEETFALELSRLKESHDRALEVRKHLLFNRIIQDFLRLSQENLKNPHSTKKTSSLQQDNTGLSGAITREPEEPAFKYATE
ncbi:hypothetical protein D1007_30902 [Hordeum vulgare]|nr:hypothetical protein D1007_30902 [Hordeum vulgare]